MATSKRSIQTMFTSTVLCLEAFVVLFAMLAVAGLQQYSKVKVFGIGFTLAALLIICCAFVKKQEGILAGWALQILLILGGFVMPEMFVLGGLFAIAWWYAVTKGRELDKENVLRREAEAEYERFVSEDANSQR